jgi:hypothetical protein
VRKVAARVERLRGLEFKRIPKIQIISGHRFDLLQARLARVARRRTTLSPLTKSRDRRRLRAEVRLDQLAGLLPPLVTFGPDAAGGLDRVGGAYDYSADRIVLLRHLIINRRQLLYTLAHELTHALENQNLHLHLADLNRPTEAATVRRAVIEGTATFVQTRYLHRYQGDKVSVRQRIEGTRSVIGASNAPYALNAQAVFDYVDGALFVDRVYRRGGWPAVARALRHPPRTSRAIIHPRFWPGAPKTATVHLDTGRILGHGWRELGGGVASEQQAVVILVAGAFEAVQADAFIGASGWAGGRFEVWRPTGGPSGCRPECATGDVGVVAFHWQGSGFANKFKFAAPPYLILALHASRTSGRAWQLPGGAGYVCIASAARGSALAFAPSARLAESLSQAAARQASNAR